MSGPQFPRTHNGRASSSPNDTNNRSGDRAQAFTLEGFIAAFILLIAVLFAVQSVVITPATGGAVDRTAQDQLQQQVQDSLVIAQQDEAEPRDLSEMVRYIEVDEGEFQGFCLPEEEGTSDEEPIYDRDVFEGENDNDDEEAVAALGPILEQHLDSGQNYNVELHFDESEDGDRDSIDLVNEGTPSSTAVTASYTVVLHEGQSTKCEEEGTKLGDIDNDDEYIPNLGDSEDNVNVYNTVEIRVVVW